MKKIDISRVKTTRDGSEVLELHRLEHLPGYAWAGVVKRKGTTSISLESWTEEGKYFSFSNEKSDLDLVETNPYADWKVDDKVWVRAKGGTWMPRHFSRVDSEGVPHVFVDGKTSFTSDQSDYAYNDTPIDSAHYYEEIRLASEFTPGQDD